VEQLSALLTRPPLVAAVLTPGAAGVLAGAAARLLLARLRRGARVRAPVCELAVAVGWAACGAGWALGLVPPPWVAVLVGLWWLVVAASVTDLVHRRLPDALVLPAFPAALLLVAPLGGEAVLRAATGALLTVAAHAPWHLLAPRALGAGDVKLAAPLGAVLAAAAWPAPLLAAGLAAVFTGGAAATVVVAARLRRRPRPAAIAHGPSMLAATVVTLATVFAAGAPP